MNKVNAIAIAKLKRKDQALWQGGFLMADYYWRMFRLQSMFLDIPKSVNARGEREHGESQVRRRFAEHICNRKLPLKKFLEFRVDFGLGSFKGILLSFSFSSLQRVSARRPRS